MRWTVGMLVEMIGRAILAERPKEVERLMRELAVVLRSAVEEHQTIDPSEMRAIREAANWLAKVQKKPG